MRSVGNPNGWFRWISAKTTKSIIFLISPNVLFKFSFPYFVLSLFLYSFVFFSKLFFISCIFLVVHDFFFFLESAISYLFFLIFFLSQIPTYIVSPGKVSISVVKSKLPFLYFYPSGDFSAPSIYWYFEKEMNSEMLLWLSLKRDTCALF